MKSWVCLAGASREGADLLTMVGHPLTTTTDGLIGVIIKQSLLDTASGSVLYRKVIDYSIYHSRQ